MKRLLSKISVKSVNFPKLLINRKNYLKKFIGFSTGCVIIHLIYINKDRTIKFIHKDTKNNQEIINSIKDLKSKIYIQSPFFFSRCFEILYGNYEKRDMIKYQREIIYTKNGENIAVDYCLPSKNKNQNPKKPVQNINKNKKKTPPIAIIIPGLSGNSDASYIRAQASNLQKNKFITIAFNPVGNAIPQITPHLFDYRNLISELDHVVNFAAKKFPNSNIYLIGFSMGSSYGAKYLSTSEGHKKIKGMVCISNPFNLLKASVNLSEMKNYVYSKFLTNQLINKTVFNLETLEKFVKKNDIKDFCLEKLKKSSTIFDYDKFFTFKLIERGHENAGRFYQHFSCHEDIKDIERPVLFIQSGNDPISKVEFLPRQVILQKENLLAVVTPRGAHVEYFVNWNAKRWYVDVTRDYLLHLENNY